VSGAGVTTTLGSAALMQAMLMAARKNTVMSRRMLFMLASPRKLHYCGNRPNLRTDCLKV
jgi:hypothetical protein